MPDPLRHGIDPFRVIVWLRRQPERPIAESLRLKSNGNALVRFA